MRCVFRAFVLSLFFVVAVAGRAQEMLSVSRLVMADQLLSSPAAEYPEDAKAASIEGTVVLDVVISKTGAVEQVVIVSGPDKLRDAAKNAVSKWTYKPYMVDGVATEVDTKVWVEFSLKGAVSRNASSDAAASVTDARVEPPSSSAVVAKEATPEKPMLTRLSSGIVAAQILHREAPIYPYAAKMSNVSGAVVMHAIISKSGTIENLQVVSGDPLLRDAALVAVKKWTYKPFLLNGQPVAVETTITVNFQQDRRPPSQRDPTSSSPYGPQTGAGVGPPH